MCVYIYIYYHSSYFLRGSGDPGSAREQQSPRHAAVEGLFHSIPFQSPYHLEGGVGGGLIVPKVSS